MSFIAALGILMAGICPAVFFSSDGILGRHTAVQKGQDTRKQLYSLTLASINTDFAFSLYKKLALKNPHKNIVFSPLGIATALASLSLGTKGKTLEEILEGLKFNLTETAEADNHHGFGHLLQRLSQPGDQVQISTANAMVVEKHLHIPTEFKEKARTLYQPEVFTADFQQPREATKLINDYVSNLTQGKIKELVSDLDKRTSMVMVNYLLFRGKWKVPFDPDDTYMGKFIVESKRPVKVPMMKIEDLRTPYFRDEKLKCTVVELNYKGNGKAMFILPDQGRMQQVEASLQPETLRKWKNSLRPRMIDELHLPKISLSQHYNLEDILPELGIKQVFSTQADLSGITGDKKIRVSQMVHKAVLDMTETGTKVDATTGAIYNFLSSKMYPMLF
ncbi:serine protease inhibitor A3B-like [Mus pahari]|uniref:serine protease inhibitor A3B-like n=1 Tax=Mus pahari TaxID=10093 RepID=UPI000A3070BA|nr:serine protease inhibitor A3B-like [Mus pahari]